MRKSHLIVTALAAVAALAAPTTTATAAPVTRCTQAEPPRLGFTTELDGVAIAAACDYWVVGSWANGGSQQPLAYHWNGHVWTAASVPARSGSDDYLKGISVVSPTNIWAVGYAAGNNLTSTLIEHWNGAHWRIVASPSPAGKFGTSRLYGVWAASASNIWAAGYAQNGPSRGLIEHWNGTNWSAITEPIPPGTQVGTFLHAIAGSSKSNVWAVGDYCRTGNSICVPVFYHWNGTKWSKVSGAGLGSGYGGNAHGVATSSQSNVWIVGDLFNSGNDHALIEHWNGHAWRLMSAPTPATWSVYLSAVTATSRAAVAVGSYQTSGKQYDLVLTWNGTKWIRTRTRTPLGSQTTYDLDGVAGGSCGSAWMVGYAFDNFSNEFPVVAHC